MKVREFNALRDTEGDLLVERIPYLRELKLNDFEQYKLLLAHSKIITLEPGEVLLSKGKTGKKIYFLASGHLDVFSDTVPGNMALNQLASGEIIAALSIINDQPRTATLAASRSFTAEKTKVIATDFSIFGDLHDFTNIKLATKINLLRLVINNIRFKLSTYQSNYPEHRLAKTNHHVERFTGEVDSIQELDSLSGQAFVLTHLLYKWNKEIESSVVVPEIEQPTSTKDKIFAFFGKR